MNTRRRVAVQPAPLEETITTRGRPADREAYLRPMPRTWWLRNFRYTLFLLREVSSVFLAIFAILYIVQIALLAVGPGNYSRYMALVSSPGWIALHVVVFIFAVIHTLTWLYLAPIAGPQVRLRGKPVRHSVLWLAGVLGWIGISVGIGFVILRG